MEASVTAPQSEPDQDNSSLQNPSTNPAEAGTTDEARDEDHDTSSIEALNWSEVEEEELAAAQQAATQGEKSTVEMDPKAAKKADNDDEISTANGSSTNGSTVFVSDEGKMLSTSLLQSINSSASDEDPQARKLSVIENWASEVTNAVERGELEGFPGENGVSDEGAQDNGDGVRQRKGKKLSPEMVSSVLSSASTGESGVDPLSNAPVLDDGPIWNKGPRSYRFQENRRINQKLTFCVLIAVVLAIGLGLGNLVAHQECEAEFKASQQSQAKPVGRIPAHSTPPPHIPEHLHNFHDSHMSDDVKKPIHHTDNAFLRNSDPNEHDPPSEDIPHKHVEAETTTAKRSNEPVIDPKYQIHAETLSRVVNTLDHLSRKIDQFENTTRKLQGVLVIPDEEKEKEPEGLFDEDLSIDEDIMTDEEEEMAMVDDLIDAIEDTPRHRVVIQSRKRLEELERIRGNRRSTIFNQKTKRSAEENQDIDNMLNAIQQLKNFERRFVKSERKRLVEEGKLDPETWRTPEQYSNEEKKAIGARHKAAFEEFSKLIKDKTVDPSSVIFGTEEVEEDDKYWPWSDVHRSNQERGEPSSEFGDIEADMFEKASIPFESLADTQQKATYPEANHEHHEQVHSELNAITNDDIIVMEPADNSNEKAFLPPEVTVHSVDHPPPTGNEENGGKSATVRSPVDSGVPLSDSQIPPSHSTSSSTTNQNENRNGLGPGKVNKKSSSTKQSQIQNKPATKSSKKAKKVSIALSNNNENGNASPLDSGGSAKSSKQKDQKKQGKSKLRGGESTGNGVNGSSTGKLKIASKLKKLKNLESNKAFETVKGKSHEKRRRSSETVDGKRVPGLEDGRQTVDAGKKEKKKFGHGKKQKEGRLGETFGDSKSGKDNHKKFRNNSGRNQHPPNEPKYYDPRDQVNGEGGNDSDYDKSSKLKYESEELSTQETQYRQQKQEFNSNYDHNAQNGDYHKAGKKSKDWQNKGRDRPHERPNGRNSRGK